MRRLTLISIIIYATGCTDGRPIAELINKLIGSSSNITGISGTGTDASIDAYYTDVVINNPKVNWTDVPTATSYDVVIKDSSNTVVVCTQVNQPSGTTSYTFAGCSLVNGVTYTANVSVNFSSGSPINSTYSFMADNAPPTATCSAVVAWTNNNTYDLSTGASCNDVGGSGCNLGTILCDYSADNGTTWVGWNTCNVAKIDATSASGGQFRVKYADNSGQVGTSVNCAINIDTVSPPNVGSFTVPAGNPTNTNLASPSWTWTSVADVLSGLHAANAYEINLYSDVGCTTLVAGPINVVGTSGTVASPGDGTYYLGVRARDKAGNMSSLVTCSSGSSKSFLVDTTAPTVNCINVPGWQTSGTYNIGQSGTTYTCVDGGSGCNAGSLQCRYSADNGSSWSGWGICTAAKADRLSVGLFQVRLNDNAGTLGTSANCTVDIDASIPAAVSSTFSLPTGVADSYQNTPNISFIWFDSTVDPHSGFLQYDYELHSNASCSAPIGGTNGSIGSPAMTFTQPDGNYWLKVRAVNNAGLTSAWSCSSRQVVKDTVVPTFSTGIGMTGIPTVTLGSLQNITWVAGADTYGTGALLLEYSDDGGTSWNSIGSVNYNASPYAWNVAGVGNAGLSHLRGRLTDLAGNISVYNYMGPFNKSTGPVNYAITGPVNIISATCQMYTLHSWDNLNNDTNVPSNSTATLSFLGLPNGRFYNDALCSAQISTVTINSGTATKNFYYFNSGSSGESGNITATWTAGHSLADTNYNINVILDPSMWGNGLDGTPAALSGVINPIEPYNIGGSRNFSYSDRVININTANGRDLTLNGPFLTPDELRISDEVMWIIPMAGVASGTCDSTGDLSVGRYGFAYITAINGALGTLSLDRSITPNAWSIRNIAIAGTNSPDEGTDFCNIHIIRVPNFANLNMSSAVIYPYLYNEDRGVVGGANGGIVAFRVQGSLNLSGTTSNINVSNRGFQSHNLTYRPGIGYSGRNNTFDIWPLAFNLTGGSNGNWSESYGGGGGGGNVGRGLNPWIPDLGFYSPGCGPVACTLNNKLVFGGSGGTTSFLSGNGGGIIFAAINSIIGAGGLDFTANGEIGANGAGSSSSGGGGAGQIFLHVNTLNAGNTMNLNAKGGNGGNSSGSTKDGTGGGGGYIRANYCTNSGSVFHDVSAGLGGNGSNVPYDGSPGAVDYPGACFP